MSSMCYMLCNTRMESLTVAKGQSGRLVIEVEPAFKRQLYSALASDGLTLKAWFVEEAKRYLDGRDRAHGRTPDLQPQSERTP